MTSNIQDIRSSVKKIAWGFFLIHMHINLGPVDILPDWAGFALMVSVLTFVVAFEEDIKKLRIVGISLLVWNVIAWAGSVFGIEAYLGYVAVIPAIGRMYFFYKLFCELAGLSDKYCCSYGSVFRFLGIANAVINALSATVSYLTLIFADQEIFIVVSMFVLAIALIVMLFSMITLFRFSNALKDMPDSNYSGDYISDNINNCGDGTAL